MKTNKDFSFITPKELTEAITGYDNLSTRTCTTSQKLLRGASKTRRDLSTAPVLSTVEGVEMTKVANDENVRWVRPETLRVSFRASKTSREISEISPLKANAFQSK